MKTFVIGDIHGNCLALEQCLTRSGFDREADRLIVLGDIVDGFPDTKRCVELLMSLKNCHRCLGNHDAWAIDFFTNAGIPEPGWVKQGGLATIDSYGGIMGLTVPPEHLAWLRDFHPYIIWDRYCFVHGGFDPSKSIEDQTIDHLVWDRQLIETCWRKTVRNTPWKVSQFEEVFVGHTTTQCFGIWDGTRIIEKRPTKPLHMCNLWAMDTGAGWDGQLSIMNVETKEYWQSDFALTLYPGMGRGLRFSE